MIILEKKVGNDTLTYIVDKNKVVREFMGKQEELKGFYQLFLFTNFHNAYPLNPDYLVARGMEKLDMGKITEENTPFRTSDVVEEPKQKKKYGRTNKTPSWSPRST